MKETNQSSCPLCDGNANYRFCDDDNIKHFECLICWEFFISTSAENWLKKEKHRKEHFSKLAANQKGTANLLRLTLTVEAKTSITPKIIPRATYRL